MQEQNDDHGTRSIRVQTPQEGSACDVLDDIGYARVSGHGGRGIIQSQAYTGDSLRNEDEEKRGAEDISKPRTAPNRFVERLAKHPVCSGALVNPGPKTTVPGPPPGGGLCRRRSGSDRWRLGAHEITSFLVTSGRNIWYFTMSWPFETLVSSESSPRRGGPER